MKPENVEYIRYRNQSSKETLKDARLLLENGSLRSAVNRLYYACFYAVSALLLTDDLHSSKHSGIRALFIKHWIKTGHSPQQMGRFYLRLFERRQTGDYHDLVTFEREEVESWYREAEAFITEVVMQTEKRLVN